MPLELTTFPGSTEILLAYRIVQNQARDTNMTQTKIMIFEAPLCSDAFWGYFRRLKIDHLQTMNNAFFSNTKSQMLLNGCKPDGYAQTESESKCS